MDLIQAQARPKVVMVGAAPRAAPPPRRRARSRLIAHRFTVLDVRPLLPAPWAFVPHGLALVRVRVRSMRLSHGPPRATSYEFYHTTPGVPWRCEKRSAVRRTPQHQTGDLKQGHIGCRLGVGSAAVCFGCFETLPPSGPVCV
jgi:hypothetical protein